MQPCECLTPKEMQVATLVWEGLTNRQIAAIIGTSEQVVKNYLRTTCDKLGSGAGWSWRCMWPAKVVPPGGIHGIYLRNPHRLWIPAVFCRRRVKDPGP
jgi:hypothetical protein